MTAITKPARKPSIFSLIRRQYSRFTLPEGSLPALCYHGVHEEYTMAEAVVPEIAEQIQTTAEPQRAPAKEVKRQTIGFTFFKVLPEWRRLPAQEKDAHRAAFAAVIPRWKQPGRLLTL